MLHTMDGPSEFHVVDPLKDWNIISDQNRQFIAKGLIIVGAVARDACLRERETP